MEAAEGQPEPMLAVEVAVREVMPLCSMSEEGVAAVLDWFSEARERQESRWQQRLEESSTAIQGI